MAKFKSLKDAMKYIEKATSDSMQEVGRELEEIMKEEIQTQVYDAYNPSTYDRTKQLLNSVETTNVSDNSVEVSWRDNGDWTSYAGKHMYVIHGLEMGKTYGKGGYRPSTNLVEESYRRAENEIPKKYKTEMKKRGIPIK